MVKCIFYYFYGNYPPKHLGALCFTPVPLVCIYTIHVWEWADRKSAQSEPTAPYTCLPIWAPKVLSSFLPLGHQSVKFKPHSVKIVFIKRRCSYIAASMLLWYDCCWQMSATGICCYYAFHCLSFILAWPAFILLYFFSCFGWRPELQTCYLLTLVSKVCSCHWLVHGRSATEYKPAPIGYLQRVLCACVCGERWACFLSRMWLH